MRGGEVGRNSLFVIAVGLLVAFPSFAARPGSAVSIIPCPHSAGGVWAVPSEASSQPSPLNPCPGGELAKAIGSADWERTDSVQVTADNGYILSAKGFGSYATYVIKLDVSGAVQWQKAFPQTGRGTGDVRSVVRELPTGGYVFMAGLIAGSSRDAFVAALDASGNLVWQKSYAGPATAYPQDIDVLSDGGFIVAAAMAGDAWVLRLDATGAVVWQETLGTADPDSLQAIRQTSDGGFVAAGTRNVASVNVGWIAKLDAAGGLQWAKTFTGTGDASLSSIEPTPDGGYVASGYSGGGKGTVLRLDAVGSIVWQKTYHLGPSLSAAFQTSIGLTADGGYVLAYARNVGSRSQPNDDIAVTRLDGSGNVVWHRTYGGSGEEYTCVTRCVMQNAYGGFVVGGTTASYGSGSNDLWVLVLDPTGVISASCPSTVGQSQSASIAAAKLKAMTGSSTVAGTGATGVDPGIALADAALATVPQC